MSLQRNSQRRFQSSIRTELARDLHDSLAQELVAIGFQLDLLIADLPWKYRKSARDIRLQITDATKEVRKELFALRKNESNYQSKLTELAGELSVQVTGELSSLNSTTRRVVDELVRNAATHSKGRLIQVIIEKNLITVSDDGQGFFGVNELVASLGGQINVTSSASGTKVEIRLP